MVGGILICRNSQPFGEIYREHFVCRVHVGSAVSHRESGELAKFYRVISSIDQRDSGIAT